MNDVQSIRNLALERVTEQLLRGRDLVALYRIMLTNSLTSHAALGDYQGSTYDIVTCDAIGQPY